MLTDEQAKAIQEVAKTTGKALDLVGSAGSVLVNGTVGRITSATLRLAGGDWVCEAADRNLARLKAKTAKILDGIAQERLSEPSPSVVKPLLEAAADESREELQDLWAALLANAMVDGGRKVRRDYFEAVRQMEPLDARALDLVSRRPNKHAPRDVSAIQTDQQFFDRERQRLGIAEDDWTIAREKLEKLGCILPSSHGPLPLLAAFGRGLLAACTPPIIS